MITIMATGFIAQQPELKYAGDKAILEFQICDSRRELRGNEFHTVWERVTCVLFDKEAIKYAEKLTKGRTVEVVGSQRTSVQETENGKRYYTKYYVDRINLPYQEQRESKVDDVRGSPAPQTRGAQSRPNTNVQHMAGTVKQRVENAEPIPFNGYNSASKSRFAANKSQEKEAPKVVF